ncbi:MAG: hypothetical protein JWN62_2104 [Acidimicrobiales bacterium]|nr:hypothetical protein [Acidimicrobiales bacterium]
MRITQLWRYPVKSMQGEPLAAAEIGSLGIVGDRAWALRDLTTGLTLTARREPSLLFASGRIVDGHAVVRLPGGVETDADDVLSAWIGRDVALVAAADDEGGTYEIATDAEREDDSPWRTWTGPGGAFHDSARARVSIIGEQTLREWPVRRFRPNMLVDGGSEDALVGSVVRVGSAVELDVIKQIDRCVMITRPQPDGIERDLDVLRTVNRERGTFLGVGALVNLGGTVAVGDEIVPA